MAEVVAPGSQAQLSTSSSRHQHHFPHGIKRAADGELEGEQRLSKRFDLLDLNKNGSRLYIPVPGSNDVAATVAPSMKLPPKPLPNKETIPRRRKSQPVAASDDLMQVEDTPHTVYIHDLDAELSDIESDEDNPIFLADIEKHLAKIPKHLLTGPELKATKDNAMVLYQVPSSLTIPEAQDSVRKAIVEARARIRERQVSGVEEVLPPPQVPLSNMGMSGSIPGPANDPDAMELD